jgi:hypothetical protein
LIAKEKQMADPKDLPKQDAMLFRKTGLTITDHDGLVAIHHPQMPMDLSLTPINNRLLAEALLKAAERVGHLAQ